MSGTQSGAAGAGGAGQVAATVSTVTDGAASGSDGGGAGANESASPLSPEAVAHLSSTYGPDWQDRLGGKKKQEAASQVDFNSLIAEHFGQLQEPKLQLAQGETTLGAAAYERHQAALRAHQQGMSWRQELAKLMGGPLQFGDITLQMSPEDHKHLLSDMKRRAGQPLSPRDFAVLAFHDRALQLAADNGARNFEKTLGTRGGQGSQQQVVVPQKTATTTSTTPARQIGSIAEMMADPTKFGVQDLLKD